MMPIAFRLAHPDDLPAINAFDVFSGDRASEIAQGRVIVATDGDRVVGYIVWQRAGFIGNDLIKFLNVRETHRRRGIARSLVRAAEDQLSGRMFISTEDDNAAMLAMFPDEGWTYAGAVAGANTGGRAEVFFYKDRP